MKKSGMPACNTKIAALGASAAVIAVKAAVSAVIQRRRGARESTRVLYYRAHSILRSVRSHLEAVA